MTPSGAWRVPCDGGAVPAVWDLPTGRDPRGVFVCAPGAGGRIDHRSLTEVSDLLTARGLGVVRFHFPYQEQGRRYPDPMPRLVACVAAVTETIRGELAPDLLIVGGRSMGGRAASMAVAQGLAVDGLLLLAYPLHAPGTPQKTRDAHLDSIHVPTLCFNGTRDSFCRKDLMAAVAARLGATWTMYWLEGADHSFHVPRSSGRNDAGVLDEIGDRTRLWVSGLEARPRGP